MPNYSRLEKEILTPPQVALLATSRAPAIGALKDAALYRAIKELEAEIAQAGDKSDGGEVSAADLLITGLKRLHAERRKRKLPVDPAAATAGPAAQKAASATRRAPASPARKPAGRAKSEARKPDQRTGSHRVATKKKLAAAMPVAPAPADVATSATPALAASQPVLDAKELRKEARKAARKAERKAARQAEKAAEKDARKAERKAARQAERDAKQAEKQAAREAKKATRKAERAAAKAKAGIAEAAGDVVKAKKKKKSKKS